MDKEYPLKDFNSLKQEMEERWEIPPDFDPQMWLLCSERADRLTESRDYYELSKLYSHMADFLQEEGRPSHCVREEFSKALLLHFRHAVRNQAFVAGRQDHRVPLQPLGAEVRQ